MAIHRYLKRCEVGSQDRIWRLWVLFALCALLVARTWQVAQAEVLSTEEMESAKAALIAWSASLVSFDGCYRLEQYRNEEPETERLVLEIAYRFQGADRLLTHTKVDASGKVLMTTDALLDGKLSTMYTQGEANDTMVSGTLGLAPDRGTFTPWSLVSPEMLFGRYGDLPPLDEFLASGETVLLRMDGQRVLRHFVRPHILSIWLDAANRVEKYELAFGLPLETIAESWTGNPYDIRQVFDTLEVSDYVEIGGIPFPTAARRTWWRFDEDQFEALKATCQTQGWDDVEYHIRACSEVETYAFKTQEFRLDVASARVNMELPRSAFKIDYPEEAVLWNHKGKRIDNIPWWRHWWVLGAAVLVLAAASVGVWYWRTQ